ncbi:MAG: 4-hydroxy-tetrahydrodipicolinate synthase [Pseudomonadota bacterium]
MFKGSMVALITPFAGDKVDHDALKRLVDWHIAEGTDGLVPVGTTGESPTLSHAEHDAVVATVVDQAAGRVPVLAGAGSNNTAEAVRLTQAAKDAGADGALVVTPYYNKPTQRGLVAHYEACAAVGLPIIIYNIPPRSVIDMSDATMAELAKLPEIVGVKDATADLARVPATRLSCGADFIQVSGEDATAVGYNAMGGVGCISVTANVAPKLCAQMQAACLAGDYGKAVEIQDVLMPLHQAVFTEPGLCGAKYGAAKLGLCSDAVRPPLVTLSDATKARMDAAMARAGLL